jgi:ABC-type multidrug transport system ATPase subunit
MYAMAQITNLSKRYGSKIVLDGIHLEIHAGTHWGIFGENGAGKTSLARLLAGLEKPTAGKLSLTDLGRPVLVQQDFVVWPHLSVRENVSIACAKDKRSDPRGVDLWLERFDLLRMARSLGGNLSYGQQQRLSLARAFASGACFFIFDEVFSGLDAISHLPLLLQVKGYLKELGATSIWISHDWAEISIICDQVAVLGNGKILQTGKPEKVYRDPTSVEVAQMTGRVNILSAAEWTKLLSTIIAPPQLLVRAGDAILIRPEDISIRPSPVMGNFALKSEWFLAPGYLQQILVKGDISLQIFSIDAWTQLDEASAELKQPPCVLSYC